MKYGPEITGEIAWLLREGSNRTDACITVGIHYDTFCEWMDKSEFSDAIKKAEVGFKNDNILLIRKAAVTSWQAAAWLLERKYQSEFALKRDDRTNNDIPQKMADRAAQLLNKLEKKNGNPPIPATPRNGTVHA